jgi:predicted transglutaminase-like cysteine proteinase
MKALMMSVLAPALFALMPSCAMATPQGGALADADFVTAPRDFQNFCLVHSDQCLSHGHASLVSLNEARLAELEDVNRRVNLEIRPLPAPPPGDAYRLGVDAGSCNEYAVEKRRRLLALGWPGAALSLAVVVLPDGRGHLVLTVRTDRGDIVLDNLTGRLTTADRTHYTWLERQSTIHPMLWVRIGGKAGGALAGVSFARSAELKISRRPPRPVALAVKAGGVAATAPAPTTQTSAVAVSGPDFR